MNLAKEYSRIFDINFKKKEFWKKLKDEISNAIDENGLKDRYTINSEYARLMADRAYWRAKAEAYESMLKKAKLLESDKEKIIRFDKVEK